VIASLCLLSFFFFFFGHVFRINLVRRISQFLFYEAEEIDAQEAPRTGRAAKEEESSSAFVLLLLVAALYGLGVITEIGRAHV
jgi:hypothetical protein